MSKTEEFYTLARERFAAASLADQADREEAQADNHFAQGGLNQWKPEDVEARESARRPVLVWNRLHIFTAQVVNDGRQSKPAIKIAAMDGGKKETAEFYQGRIRHIEYDSDADIAYDTARDQQVTSGRGSIRLRTRFVPHSMDQEIRIERIENQFTVLWDPHAKEYDRSDAEYCFVVTTMSREAFEREYGKDTQVSRSSFYMAGDNPAPDWIGTGTSGEDVQVAEYWHKEHRKRVLCELHGGGCLYEDDLPADLPETAITARRDEDEVTVMQDVINGVESLDNTEWIGSGIPIFPLWGRESFEGGKRRTTSLIRHAKDPQRLVNLYVSNIAEQISQMPKTPYLAAEGQITNHEQDWEQINTSPKAVVLYKPLGIGGIVVGAPQRVVNEPPIQALTLGLNQAIDAIKSAMGIFDASIGQQARETSGLAIEKRQRQADNANFHFHDNEARTRRALGRALLEIIPILDKGDRTVPVRSVDGKTKLVRVNAPHLDEETGQSVFHDLTSGAYGCAVENGKSYDSAREEAFEVYSQIASADKNFMQVAGDVFFRAMDAPGSDQLADRYEKLLPPALQSQKPGNQPDPQKMQAQFQQLAQQHEQLVNVVHQQASEIEAKSAELQSRERIAEMQETTKRTIALATLDQKDGIALLTQQIAVLQAQTDQLQQVHSEQLQRNHEAMLQAAGQQHAAQLQDAQHAQQASLQDSQQAAQAQQQQAAQESPAQENQPS